jgi:hypothetical protein
MATNGGKITRVSRVRKISLIMNGYIYIHVRSFSQKEEICSLKECKSHLKSLLTNFRMKMVIQIYTQVLIQTHHCEVTGLLLLLRHEKRLTTTEYKSHKVSRDHRGFVFCFI